MAIAAGGPTDLFNNPDGSPVVNNSPRLLFDHRGDFTLRALVEVEFKSTFDAGVLLIHGDDAHWAKLC